MRLGEPENDQTALEQIEEVLLYFATLALAIGRFLSYQIREEVARGELVPLLESYAPEALSVSLVTSGAAPLPRRVTAVIDELRSSLRRELAE